MSTCLHLHQQHRSVIRFMHSINSPLHAAFDAANVNVRCAGSVQDPSEGQSTLARLFANGTAENRAATEAKATNGIAPKLLADAQARKSSLLPAWSPCPLRKSCLPQHAFRL